MRELQEILNERDSVEINSVEWDTLNEEKARVLIAKKPSNDEQIVCFNENDLNDLPIGFIHTNVIPNIPMYIINRAVAEYHPLKRHPIPYAIIQYEDSYFLILREKGSGEDRLIGKKGLIGGHVSEEDLSDDLSITLNKALKREYLEEVSGIEPFIVDINLQGIIKNNDGVDADHLGFVYIIKVNSTNFSSSEDGVISGIWIDKKDLKNHIDSFESWLKIVYDNILT